MKVGYTTSSLRHLSLGLLVTLAGFFAYVSPVHAQVFEDITQNITSDTSGNVGTMSFYGPYGNSNPDARNARIVVPLPVPDSENGPRLVRKVTIEMHDHDEAFIFDLRLNQDSLPNLLSNVDIVTANGIRCNDRDFIKRIQDHHYPDNAAQDADCYTAHSFDINQPITGIVLNVSRAKAKGNTSTEQHLHIRNVIWTIEKEEPPPVPEPQLSVQNCVMPNATQQTNDILKITWGSAATPIQTVAISDSQAANRWDSTAGRFWSKETRGATTIFAPAGFFPRSPTTPNPLIFKPNTVYSVVLWDGSRLSNPKDVTFQACQQTQMPATASLSNACIPRTSTQPLAYDFTLNSIDTKEATFTKSIFYLNLEWNTSTALLRNYLGTPSWSDWEANKRNPQTGDKFGYTLASYDELTPFGIAFTWSDNQLIGGTRGNQRRLSELVNWVKTTNYPTSFTISALIQTTASGNIIESKPVASTIVEISPLACMTTTACVPSCGLCSLPGSSDGCGGICPVGEWRGAPNPVELLTPADGQPLQVNGNTVTVSWRQQPTTNSNAGYVDTYQVLLYPSDKYTNPAAAVSAYLQNSGDVVFFYYPAAQGNPAAILAKQVALPPALLSATQVSIALRALNLTCPSSTETSGNASNPQLPEGEQVPPWTVEPPHVLEAAFAGKFYKSESCTLAGAEPLTLGGNSLVTITEDSTNQQTSAVPTGTGYSIAVSPATKDYFPVLKFDQVGQSETLACSTCNPADSNGACQRPRTTGPTANAHFFLESYNLKFVDSWWQARGGLVYGHNGIRSALPLENGEDKNEDCRDAGEYCDPFLVRKLLGGSDLSAGIPFTGGSFIDVDDWWTDRADEAHANNGVDAKTRVTREGYAFFIDLLEEPPTQDISSSYIDALSKIPSGTESRGAKLSYRNGNLTFNPNQTWDIPSGEKRVIFVNGNLTVSQTPEKIINVAPGGFLAFIVSGDIIFDATVGYTSTSEIVANSSLDPNIEGVFIADGSIIVESAGSDDKKFVGEGSFVGWSGVRLMRTFENGQLGRVRNNTTPIENFLYRPDFLVHAPDLIRTTETTWREVN